MTEQHDRGTSLDKRIAEGVRVEMARQQRSQTALAAELGLVQSSVSRKMSGDRPFTAAELIVVASFLNVEIAELLTVAA